MSKIFDDTICRYGNCTFRKCTDTSDISEGNTWYEVIRYAPNNLYGKIDEFILSTSRDDEDTETRFYFHISNPYHLYEESIFSMKLFPYLIGYFQNDDSQEGGYSFILKNDFIKECTSIIEFSNAIKCIESACKYLQCESKGKLVLTYNSLDTEGIIKKGNFVLRKTPYGYEIVVLRENKYYLTEDKRDWKLIKYGDKSGLNILSNLKEHPTCDTMLEAYFDMPKIPFLVGKFYVDNAYRKLCFECNPNCFGTLCVNSVSLINLMFIIKESAKYIETNGF